jgi:hypothetical protein
MDWNLYNKTHYDEDNPPPKMVQGYKFHIFYPALVNSTRSPKYTLEGAEDQEHAIIRFQAGAPYEDIAFRIMNKQWEVDGRNGFRCTFDGGILELHFDFKRFRYRR